MNPRDLLRRILRLEALIPLPPGIRRVRLFAPDPDCWGIDDPLYQERHGPVRMMSQAECEAEGRLNIPDHDTRHPNLDTEPEG